MVDDETTQDLITWTGSGDQFTVFNNTEFSRTVLPRYFKHCNWSSFVRQLNMYDFHKINENNNDEEINTNEVQTQRWDFKHPWFNKAGFDRLHKIRRKPPRNRLIPQIRYSSAMEILPSNSPDYEVDPSSLASENSPVSDSASVSAGGSGGMHSQHNTGVQDAINQLQGKAGHLESKLDFTANEVQYLRKVTENQQEILNDLLASVEYLKSKYGMFTNIVIVMMTYFLCILHRYTRQRI
ncbi:HSF-type DNA-binding-domain-containing protein [Mucor mucedo]|uniref:HSF-type DNA-binding-domain-containing protein n=1 Tax=Mucor mucedo TaxID=29922 RepID=UPI002221138F|nr:HSF-type DNA-binding-domain-containing protein [Mucor mucedo]KAI7873296.1 HSF-type DNA-binding-domain-containing protein [Mucor mucedo]